METRGVEIVINRDIQNIQSKRYTEDREVKYRRNFKAIKEFFEAFAVFNVDIDHPYFKTLIKEGHYLTHKIITISEEYATFDYESYSKFLEVFKKIIQFRDDSDELNELLDYLHL